MSEKNVTMNIRHSSLLKYKAIQERFKHLYETQRLRLDDVETTLCQEFFLSRHRIMIILKMDLK